MMMSNSEGIRSIRTKILDISMEYEEESLNAVRFQ